MTYSKPLSKSLSSTMSTLGPAIDLIVFMEDLKRVAPVPTVTVSPGLLGAELVSALKGECDPSGAFQLTALL
jgi:hypothetical protein